MNRTDTLIIGGSQAGLAMSRALTDLDVDHLILERGRIGERWRSERWASLRLLTPRWLSRIGGWPGGFGDPDAFMHKDELVTYLEAYASSFLAPIRQGTTVFRVESHGDGFRVRTNAGVIHARNVVVATGHSQHARIPAFGRRLDGGILQVTPTRYRTPTDIPDGGVLVVGASATGIQLADELHRAGRRVVVSVGRHTRMPRRYRDRDVLEWLHRMGSFAQTPERVRDPEASRGQPSLQLVGSLDHASLDLGVLQARGIECVGRASWADGGRMHFDDDLVENVAAADFKWASLRTRIDQWIDREGFGAFVAEPDDFRPVPLPDERTHLDFRAEGIRTVLWATGFGRSYPWLKVPVLDARGEIIQRGGVTPVPGLYTLGLNFQRRRSSSFLVGVASDAAELARHLVRTRHGARDVRLAGRGVA